MLHLIKKLFLASLCSLAFSNAHAVEEDKLKHALVSAVIATSVVWLKPQSSVSEQFLWSMAPGLIKEVLDSRQGGEFSWQDLAADAIGVSLGLTLGHWRVHVKNRDNFTVAYTTTFK